MLTVARLSGLLLLAAACAGCGGSNYAGGTAGRGYDGNGDYGYDLAASRAEARGYRIRAARNYPVPGTPDDPWKPYIQQAAVRYQVPERWIREVMRQESGGRQQSADGTLTISNVGAMGLMQVMPSTYDILRQHYGLGDDPYEPQDNILAGTAYIREMYDRYGSPGFLAAYNAGPNRLDAYLAGSSELPDETVNYLAGIAPRLGDSIAATGPLAAYAGGSGVPQPQMRLADRAFDGGGLITADAPTGLLTGNGGPPAVLALASTDAPSRRPVLIAALRPMSAAGTRPITWAIQVGAFPDPATSQAAIATALDHAGRLLAGGQPAITTVQRGTMLYRARLVGLTADNALAACTTLQHDGLGCFTVPPGS